MVKFLAPLEMLIGFLKSNQGNRYLFYTGETLAFVTEYWI